MNKAISTEYVLECLIENDKLFNGWNFMFKHPSLEEVVKVKNAYLLNQIDGIREPYTEDHMRIRMLVTTQEYLDLDRYE